MFNKQKFEKLKAEQRQVRRMKIKDFNRKRLNAELDEQRVASYKDRVTNFVKHVIENEDHQQYYKQTKRSRSPKSRSPNNYQNRDQQQYYNMSSSIFHLKDFQSPAVNLPQLQQNSIFSEKDTINIENTNIMSYAERQKDFDHLDQPPLQLNMRSID